MIDDPYVILALANKVGIKRLREIKSISNKWKDKFSGFPQGKNIIYCFNKEGNSFYYYRAYHFNSSTHITATDFWSSYFDIRTT